MKNVVVVINTLKNGGAEKQSIIISNQLSVDNNVTLLVLDINGASERLLDSISDKVETLFYEGLNLRSTLSILFNEKIKRADVIISMLARSNFISSLSGLFYRNMLVFGGIRNCELKKKKFLLEYVFHRYFHDKTIFNNYSGMEGLVRKGFKAEKSICIHNCVEIIPTLSTIKNKSAFEENKLIIASLSRLISQKDIKTSLRAVEILYNQSKTTSFVYLIGGYGEMKNELQNIINDRNLNNVVEIIESPEVPKFLSQADIFLSTSLIEGTSNSILEAMSYGLPVVATDAGDNKYLIRDNENGFIVPVQDFHSVAEKIKTLIDNDQLRHNMGTTGRAIIEKEYNKETFLKKYTKLIYE